MTGHLAKLAIRRKELQLKAAAQRRQLGEHVGDIEARFVGVDRGFLKVQGLLRKPVVLVGVAAARLVTMARRFFRPTP